MTTIKPEKISLLGFGIAHTMFATIKASLILAIDFTLQV